MTMFCTCNGDCVKKYEIHNVERKISEVASELSRQSAEHKHRLDHLNEAVQMASKNIRDMTEAHEETKIQLDALVQAVSVLHVKNPDGTCVENCWSCKIA